MSADIRTAALAVARLEMHSNAREIGGNNRGPFVKKYLGGAGLEEGLPWCASFVSWCYRQAAQSLGVKMPFQYNPSAVRLFQDLSRKGWKVKEPQPGDLIFWTRGNRPGLGHVGIVEYAHDGEMQTIEGNHTSRVQRFHYEWEHEPRLLGFIRVGGE